MRNRLNSFQFASGCKLNKDQSKIRLPKLGWIKFHKFTSDLPKGAIAATVRIVKKQSGLYAIVIFKEAGHKQVVLASKTRVGIDTGFKNLLTLSDGTIYLRPKELAQSANQLAKVQRDQSKKKTARLHEKIARQRKDRNHKISHDLVRDHKEIYITNDNLKGMASKFGKSVASCGISQLRQFTLYKGSSCDRVVELVESKDTTLTCSNCGCLTGPTGLGKLNVRNWVCTCCGASHDRDINAAINILNFGERYSLENRMSKVKTKLIRLKKTKQPLRAV